MTAVGHVLVAGASAAGARQEAVGHLFAYLDNLVGEKIADPGDDLLSWLTERIANGELTRQDAAQMGVLMLIAGH